VNQREKEEYLREYSILKSQGKPFFPYAVAKDGLMGCVVVAVIMALSIVLGSRARAQGERGDDHLRAAARVVLLLPLRAAARDQAAELRRPRDDRRADDRDDPAVPAAVLRPRPGAPPAAPSGRHDGGDLRDLRDGLPDLPGRQRRRADGEHDPGAGVGRRAGQGGGFRVLLGRSVVAQSGCEACH
jgi:hypothetical protein